MILDTFRTDYHAINSTGRTVMTFDGIDALERAKAWAKEPQNRRSYGEVEIHEVTITTRSRRVYRPKPLVFEAPPACPQDRDLAIPA